MTMPFDWMKLADALGVWLATYLLHSTALLLPALALARWLGTRQLSFQESLLRVALLGGLLTASLQVGFGWQAATGSIPYPGLAARPGAESAVAGEPLDARAAAASKPAERRAGSAIAGAAPARRETAAARLPGVPWVALAVAVWLLGAILISSRLGLVAMRLRRQLLDRREIGEGRVFRLFWRLLAAADVDRPTRLTRTERLQVPVALGVGRREICLPRRVAEELPSEQQETVLAHELAHLERSDPTWLLVCRCLESVLFLQPLNLLARRQLQEIAEYRCDDWAARQTGRPLTLARCLTEVASWGPATSSAALAPTMAGRPSGLGRRVRRLLDPGYSGVEGRLPGWWRPVAAAALVLVLVAVPGFSVMESEGESEARQGAEPEVVEETGRVESEEATAPVVGPDGIVGPQTVDTSTVAALAPTIDIVAAPVALRVDPAVAVRLATSQAEGDPEVVVASEPKVVVRTVTRVAGRVRVRLQDEPSEDAHHGDSDAHGDWEAHHEWKWDEELEDELDALEDELDEVFDEIEESLESEIEVEVEALENELEGVEEEMETLLEVELETFEEELELDLEAFEEELELLEDRVEERLETVGWESREERFEADLDLIEEGFDRLADGLDDRLDRIEDRVERHLERSWERDFDHRIESRLEEIEHRMEGEAHRFEREVHDLATEARREGRRLSVEERTGLVEEARRRLEAVRPTAEELAAIRTELASVRESIEPSGEELEALRGELRQELEELRLEAQQGLLEQREALERLRREHEIL